MFVAISVNFMCKNVIYLFWYFICKYNIGINKDFNFEIMFNLKFCNYEQFSKCS